MIRKYDLEQYKHRFIMDLMDGFCEKNAALFEKYCEDDWENYKQNKVEEDAE